MSYKAYNDYELLYLFKERHNQLALEILIKKYEKYIYKKVNSFFPRKNYLDDYYQEGIICLYRAINSFKDEYNKTFMRYFEVVLERHLINQYHKDKRDNQRFVLLINEAAVDEQFNYEQIKQEQEINVNLNSKSEQLVYLYYFCEGKNVSFLMKKLKLTKKQAYNAIYRVKRKIANQLKDK